MKIRLLFLLVLIKLSSPISSQVICYSSSTEAGSRFNPGKGNAGTPRIVFDDVSIANSFVTGDSITVTKVSVGIRRVPGAPATEVKIYYAALDDTSTVVGSQVKIPPVLLGT